MQSPMSGMSKKLTPFPPGCCRKATKRGAIPRIHLGSVKKSQTKPALKVAFQRHQIALVDVFSSHFGTDFGNKLHFEPSRLCSCCDEIARHFSY
jgi:transposase-like protein